ncbi:acyl carrier protein [Limisphaera sp. 4302-co]|uniref:acyl carrier protein n=1 Tax=Limisphaera sp. 4302-co TaxID=3400417 RepID=UPI003C1F83EB
MNVCSQIEQFIVGEILAGGRERLEPGEPLVGVGGLIDSLGLLRLIQFLEETYEIHVGDGDVGEENFGTLERLTAFVEKRRASDAS